MKIRTLFTMFVLQKLRKARAWHTQVHTFTTNNDQNAVRERRRPPWENRISPEITAQVATFTTNSDETALSESKSS